jgi:hypothetical protein
MNKIYLVLLIILFECFIKSEPLEISFDYSNVKTGDISLNKIIQNEFDTIGKYFNTLFESKPNSYVYKKIKKMPKSNLKCENKEEYKYKKNDILTSTSLLILPSFTIKQKTNNNNNPTLNKCLHYRSKVVVITIDVEFKSEKNIKNEIITNFRNLNYQWTFIRFILSVLGFNNKSFSKKNIVNNVLHRDQNLLKKYDFYKSFQKFAFLSKNEITISKDKEKFKDFWPSPPKFYDIMKSIVPSKKTMASITEMTLDIMKEIGYEVNPCELILNKNICYRVNQKCLNDCDYEDYYIHYSLDTKNKRWICYYKSEAHFKNNQCSKDYGILLKKEEINKNRLIDYLRKYDYQKLILLRPSKFCPKPHPRTIFYSSVKPKEDPYQYKFIEGTEEVVIKDPLYFVITNTFSTQYNVKYFAANYNGVFTNNTKGWNFNYLWKNVNLNPYDKGIYHRKNKYQFVGRFPIESTFKDGLARFYYKQKKKFPNDYNYIPETFIYKDQKKEVFNKFYDYHYNPNDVWLFKPAKDSFARGIQILENYTEIQKSKFKNFLISRYIMNPMLIRNKKFDMRAYVLVTGMDPLKIYFYKDGYVKIPVKDYTLDHQFIKDGCIHITTSDTNLVCFNGKEYKYDTDIYDEPSNFWSYLFFERYCNRYGINYTDIMEQMKDIFVKTFISLNSEFIRLMKNKNYQDRNLYQIYGLDLLIDSNYKVYLLELNRNPSMRGGHAVADYIYENIIADILNIVGIIPFAHDDTQEPMDKNIYHYDNRTEETVDDCLCEFTRPRGMFELVFPLKDNVNKYKKFFNEVSPESNLLWNRLLESNGEYN